MTPSSRFWPEIPARGFADTADWVAVLPLAAVEQHGPHLPTGVDLLIAEAMVAHTAAALPATSRAVFLPVMAVGKSNEHIRFPGTLTLGWETATRWMLEVGESVARAGIRKLVMITSHGGNIPPMEIVARELRAKHDMLAVTTGWGRLRDMADLADPQTTAFDIHGGEGETSLMLALRPDLVHMDRADNFISAQADLAARNRIVGLHGARANAGWLAGDLNPAGTVGNAARASAERGAEDLRRTIIGFCDLIAEVEAMPLPQATPK
ncbi:MAG: creatininase family protein [Gemmobacter sp.]|nr:creatininase family protein [Gemmobacter sp.]